MKTKPQPASVEDATDTGETILHGRRTSARVSKGSPSSKRNRQEVRTVLGRSICKGPVEDAIRTYDGEAPFTIFSRSHDQSQERNELKGCRFRKIFYTDETEFLKATAFRETREYVKLTVFVSNNDETHPDPKIHVEQQTYKDGEQMTVVQQLIFGGNIRPGIEYVFKGCGDEEPLSGKRDLHVRFYSLENNIFEEYMTNSKYYGYDTNFDICLSESELQHNAFCQLTGTAIRATPNRATRFISFNSGELQALLAVKRPIQTASPDRGGEVVELINMQLKGLGTVSEDNRHVGDINLRVSVKT